MADQPPPGKSAARAKQPPPYSASPLMRVWNQQPSMNSNSFRVWSPHLNQPVPVVVQNRAQPPVPTPQTESQRSTPTESGSKRTGKKPAKNSDIFFVNNVVDNMREGRPAKRRKVNLGGEKETQDTRLRSSKPVKAAERMTADDWIPILSFVDPKTLLEAKLINRNFHNYLTTYSKIWRNSRLNHFGQDMPECPPGLTEQQYCDLLVSRGCQNSICPRENTSKVYWIFNVRLCDECFKQKTMRGEEIPPVRKHLIPSQPIPGQVPIQNDRQLWDLLPAVKADGRRYQYMREVNDTGNDWKDHKTRQYMFLRSAYFSLEAEFTTAMSEEALDSDRLKQWTDAIHARSLEHTKNMLELEKWHNQLHKSDSTIAQERRQFFVEMAAKLNPPMTEDILECMTAFKSALKSKGPPTKRSWDILRTKIMPYMEQALKYLQYKNEMNERGIPPSRAITLFRELHAHRSGRKSVARVFKTEQDVVLKLGEKVFSRCIAEGVDQSDLLLLCLRRVFEAYYQLPSRPKGLNYDGTRGEYCLSLDDARMIVEEVIEKRFPIHAPGRAAVLQKLKCRGCRRPDFAGKLHTFAGAFEHILHAHTREIGEGNEFWRFAVAYSRENECSYLGIGDGRGRYGFPWYTIPWPRCLPLVPEHQIPAKTEKWHPDRDELYIQAPKALDTSAFHGRKARETDTPRDDFAKNLVFAAETLKGLQLDGPVHMKIVMTYATELHARISGSGPSLQEFSTAFEQAWKANDKIPSKYQCGVCVQDNRANPGQGANRKSRIYPNISSLISHWDEKHSQGEQPWYLGLMSLPSTAEVFSEINVHDDKVNKAKEAMHKYSEELKTNHLKKGKSKRRQVMEQELAMEVLDRLFELNGSENEIEGGPALAR